MLGSRVADLSRQLMHSLRCAQRGAYLCQGMHKLDKKGKQKPHKGVRGDGEVYTKNSVARNGKSSESKKAKKHNDQPKQRLPAYEEYQARYGHSSSVNSQQSEAHKRSAKSESPKGGQMDSEEFERLKQARQRDKFKSLR